MEEEKIYTAEELDAALMKYAKAISGESQTLGGAVTSERILANFDKIGQMIDVFLLYPDIFLDLITPDDSEFRLYPFQRVSLRAKMRKRQVYETATRGASKSWMAFASRWLVCMLVPRHTSFVATEVKEQAVAIAEEKIQGDLWVKYPLLANEMRKYRVPGGGIRTPFQQGKGYAAYRFSSGSTFGVIGVDAARGKRRHSGIIEEVIEQDQTKINEKIIPLMNISRLPYGKKDPNPHEPFNAQKLFVTSAGFMGMFAYEKMLETLMYMVIYPDEYMLLSIDYTIPLRHGLLDPRVIRELRSSPSFDPGSFDREYSSIWSGEMKGAAISMPAVAKTRKVKRADYKARKDLSGEYGEAFYVIGADMAKDGDAKTAVSVIRVIPGPTYFRYVVVNGFISKSSDYEIVSNEIKEVALKYRARLVVIDTNGIGAAIRDWINKPSYNKETGRELPGFGIINPPKDSRKELLTHRQHNIVYEIKANGQSASDMNWFFFSRIKSGAFRMLITYRDALNKLQTQKEFPHLAISKQQRILMPYQFCDMLEVELLNLDIEESRSGTNTSMLKVKRRNNGIQKDLFSSVSYAMYGTHHEIELMYYNKKLRKRNSLTDYVMVGGGR